MNQMILDTSDKADPKSAREADFFVGRVWDSVTVVIIIIHLLGLAPAGYLAASDNGA
jgi:hypothetical protein